MTRRMFMLSREDCGAGCVGALAKVRGDGEPRVLALVNSGGLLKSMVMEIVCLP